VAETAASRNAVYSARPTLRVDGRDDERLRTNLLAMEMTEGEGGMSALELRFSNHGPTGGAAAGLVFEDGRTLKLGAALTLFAGDETEPREIFRGTVTGLEGSFSGESPPELVVLAEDALQKARMARRTAVHDQATISTLAGTVAQAAGLTPKVTGLGDDLGTQVQLNESDLAFLRRLLARHDGDLQVVEGELQVAARNEIRRGQVELAMYSSLRRVRVLADLAHQVTETTAAGWNPAQGERVSASSTGAHAGPGAGRRGAELLRGALGARSEHVADLAVATDAEAQALAEAAFDRRARRFVTVEGVAEGNPLLRVGTHLKLTGLGPRFSNTYHVVRAAHRWDAERGYETEFEAECAFLGEG
jgi:phage protein D